MKHLLVAALLGLLFSGVVLSRAEQPSSTSCDHLAWLTVAMKEMQTIKPGMTRTDLLKIFQEEGGFFNRKQRTYVFRRSPYMKVDVEFELAGDPDPVSEQPEDKIVKISRPYLQWTIFD